MNMGKKEGSVNVLDFLPCIFTVVLSGVILIFFTYQIRYIDICNQLNNLARNVILKMESARGLTPQEEAKLLETIQGYGVFDVSLEGTTRFHSGLRPGDDLVFFVQCKVAIPQIKLDGFVDLNIPGVEREIQIKRESVVLY